MGHQRRIATEGSVIVEEYMGTGTVKVPSRRSFHGYTHLKRKASRVYSNMFRATSA